MSRVSAHWRLEFTLKKRGGYTKKPLLNKWVGAYTKMGADSGHYETCTYFLRTEGAMVQDEEEKEDRQLICTENQGRSTCTVVSQVSTYGRLEFTGPKNGLGS